MLHQTLSPEGKNGASSILSENGGFRQPDAAERTRRRGENAARGKNYSFFLRPAAHPSMLRWEPREIARAPGGTFFVIVEPAPT